MQWRPGKVGVDHGAESPTPPDSGIWDDQATEVIAEARKMPLGERRRVALREAGRLRVGAGMNGAAN